MKRYIKYTVIIGLIYIVLSFLLSITIGLPPFNQGFVIGFPSIYYKFDVNPTESQHGFMGIKNVLINISIICFLSLIFFRIIKTSKSV